MAVAELPRLVGTGPRLVERMLTGAVETGLVVRSRSLAWTAPAWDAAERAVLEAVERHHRQEPLAAGLPAQAARQVTAGAPEVVEALLAAGRLVLDGPAVRLPGHGVRLDPRQEAARARVESALAERGVAVLSESDLAELGADRRLVAALSRQRTLASIAPGLYLGRRAFPDGMDFTASEARATLGTTRKTVIPLLEHLDRAGITFRAGDKRRLSPPGPPT